MNAKQKQTQKRKPTLLTRRRWTHDLSKTQDKNPSTGNLVSEILHVDATNSEKTENGSLPTQKSLNFKKVKISILKISKKNQSQGAETWPESKQSEKQTKPDKRPTNRPQHNLKAPDSSLSKQKQAATGGNTCNMNKPGKRANKHSLNCVFSDNPSFDELALTRNERDGRETFPIKKYEFICPISESENQTNEKQIRMWMESQQNANDTRDSTRKNSQRAQQCESKTGS